MRASGPPAPATGTFPHSAARTAAFTVLALFAFAGNSLLCRLALKASAIDPASFTSIRIASGAIVLCLIVAMRTRRLATAGTWTGAWALAAYALAFSFAYVDLSAATGALLLFGSVQATMIGYGASRGERLRGWRLAGYLVSLAGLVGLLLPGLEAPPLAGAALMIVAGIAWGVYTLLGRGRGDPLAVNAGHFQRAMLPVLVMSALGASSAHIDRHGALLAVLSGALTSGVGYAIWYAALPRLGVTRAAVAQLCVPVIAALGAVAWLDEALTLRLVACALPILGGIALVMLLPAGDSGRTAR